MSLVNAAVSILITEVLDATAALQSSIGIIIEVPFEIPIPGQSDLSGQ